MDNLEHIRSMEVDKLAVWIADIVEDCEVCPAKEYCNRVVLETPSFLSNPCWKAISNWLLEEAEENLYYD